MILKTAQCGTRVVLAEAHNLGGGSIPPRVLFCDAIHGGGDNQPFPVRLTGHRDFENEGDWDVDGAG